MILLVGFSPLFGPAVILMLWVVEEVVSGKAAGVVDEVDEVEAAESVSMGTLRRKIRSPILNFVNDDKT